MLSDGDTIQMYPSEETMESFMEEKTVSDVKRTFDIVYEDENILVVNKPAGLLSHAEKKDDSNTLIDQILSYLNEKGEYVPQKGRAPLLRHSATDWTETQAELSLQEKIPMR